MTTLGKARRNGRQYINPVPTSVGGWTTMVKVLRRYLTGREERVPKQPLGPFLTDARRFETPPASGLRVTWMGHSSSLVEIDGMRVLIDPVWEQRVAPVQWAGPKRFFAPPLRLEDLPRIDVVLVSHDHYDHLGARTVQRLAKTSSTAKAQWISALGVGKFLQRLGVQQVRELDWTESLKVGSLTVTALLRSAPLLRTQPRRGPRFETLWAFVCSGRSEKHCVYYGADSGEWAGFEEILGEKRTAHSIWRACWRLAPSILCGRIFIWGPTERGRNLPCPGRRRAVDADSLGTFQPGAPCVAAADRTPDFCRWPAHLVSPEPGLPTEVVKGIELRSNWWQR